MKNSQSRARVLPHNLSNEASVLGGIILRNEVLEIVPDLEPDDFYDPRHKVVFAAIRDLAAESKPIDIVTLEVEIEKRGKLDAIGGIGFLGELALKVPTPQNVETYAAEMVDHRIRRDVALRLSELQEEVYVGETSGEQLVQYVTAAMMNIRGGREAKIVTIGELAQEEAQRVRVDMAKKAGGEKVYAGVPTGIAGIDERIGGHPIGVETLYIARPSFGKTTHCMNAAWAAKRIADMDTLIVSVEDGRVGFGQRALAQESGVATERIRARKITPDEMEAVERGAARSNRRGESYVHCPGWEVDQIIRMVRRENARRWSQGRRRFSQIMIDYLQKVAWPRWAKNGNDAVGYISASLSTLAGKDEMAVVAFCQLNREVEKREDHRPRVSDIRDSGNLEQDGRLIIGVNWPHAYDPRNHPATKAELLVLKNTQGASHFDVEVYWDVETHAIYNNALDYQQARARRGF